MKHFKILVIALIVVMTGCIEDDERLDFLSSDENTIAPYYAWSNSDELVVVEGNTGVIRIENIWATSNDPVTVVIELSGPAASEVGTEVTITNATTVAGGEEGNANSIEISGTTITGTINNADTLTSVPLDLRITVADDDVTDGDKLLNFTIISATRGGESLGIGDNDGELIVKPVIIGDADCPSSLDGTYDSGNNCFATDASTPTLTETATNGVYDLSDFTGGFYAFAGAPQVAATMNDACDNLSIANFVAFGVLEFENITGIVNADGSLSITWSEASGFGNGGVRVTCTSTLTPQ